MLPTSNRNLLTGLARNRFALNCNSELSRARMCLVLHLKVMEVQMNKKVQELSTESCWDRRIHYFNIIELCKVDLTPSSFRLRLRTGCCTTGTQHTTLVACIAYSCFKNSIKSFWFVSIFQKEKKREYQRPRVHVSQMRGAWKEVPGRDFFFIF